MFFLASQFSLSLTEMGCSTSKCCNSTIFITLCMSIRNEWTYFETVQCWAVSNIGIHLRQFCLGSEFLMVSLMTFLEKLLCTRTYFSNLHVEKNGDKNKKGMLREKLTKIVLILIPKTTGRLNQNLNFPLQSSPLL